MSTQLALGKKNYLRDKQGALAHLRPKSLFFSMSYSAVMWGERYFNAYIALLKAEDNLHELEADLAERQQQAESEFLRRVDWQHADNSLQFLAEHRWDVQLAVRNFNAQQLDASQLALSAASAVGDAGSGDGQGNGSLGELVRVAQQLVLESERDMQIKKKQFEAARDSLEPERYAVIFSKIVAVTSTKRTLESLYLRNSTEHALSKVIKDVSKSASRKFAREGGGRIVAGQGIFGTALRGEALGCIAFALIEQLHMTIDFLMKGREGSGKASAAKQDKSQADSQCTAGTVADPSASARWTLFAKTTFLNALRCAVALFFNACGASVGTVVKPGYGTTAGQLVAGFAVDPAMKQLVKILGLAG